MSSNKNSWISANQRYLTLAIRYVREVLDQHVQSTNKGNAISPSPEKPNCEELESIAKQMDNHPALEIICSAFNLTSFERSILVLCAGNELDSTIPGRCAAIHKDTRKNCATFGLALALFPDAHWSALSPDSPLRRWRLIEILSGDGLVQSPLRIDERVLHFLTGVDCLDARLESLVEPVRPVCDLSPSQISLVRKIVSTWKSETRDLPLPVIQISGADDLAKLSVAAFSCLELGLTLYRLDLANVPANAVERDALARLWERESVFGNRILLLDGDKEETSDSLRVLLPFLNSLNTASIVLHNNLLQIRNRRTTRFDMNKPDLQEQEFLWKKSLGDRCKTLNGELKKIAVQFNLSSSNIRSIVSTLAVEPEGSPGLGQQLWDACRVQSRPRLDDLAQRIDSQVEWEDLVLPVGHREILHEIASHVRQRSKVYFEWGFATKSNRGLGISALFAGQSGTGKTMAAEVLATELSLDLYRIDLSQVVSKYIGETEKNLRKVFDSAEDSGSILLFDEADAIFGKRSEVKDSHDRYANMEISYLLQRMEAYRGLAILTTNMKEAIDQAFIRRIRFIVQFPFPEANQRAEIWQRVFHANTPTEDLDVAKLARLNVAGGSIRNIAVNAAFLAADAGVPVQMSHLLRAARFEYAKLERTPTDSEINGWV